MDNVVDENGKLKLKSKKLIKMLGGVSEFNTSKGITHDIYFNGQKDSNERMDFEDLSDEELKEFSNDMMNIINKLKLDKVIISGIKWPEWNSAKSKFLELEFAIERLITSASNSLELTNMDMPKNISGLLEGRDKPLKYLNIQMDANENLSEFTGVLNSSFATRMSISKDMGETYLGIDNMEQGIWRARIGAKEYGTKRQPLVVENQSGQIIRQMIGLPVEIQNVEMDNIASALVEIHNQNKCPEKVSVTGIKTNNKKISSVLKYLSSQNKKVEFIDSEIPEPEIENEQNNLEVAEPIAEPVVEYKQNNLEVAEPIVENKPRVRVSSYDTLTDTVENKQSDPGKTEPVVENKQNNPEVAEPVVESKPRVRVSSYDTLTDTVENKQSDSGKTEPVVEKKQRVRVPSFDPEKKRAKEEAEYIDRVAEIKLSNRIKRFFKKIPIIKILFKNEVPKLEASRGKNDSMQSTYDLKHDIRIKTNKKRTNIQNSRESSIRKGRNKLEER